HPGAGRLRPLRGAEGADGGRGVDRLAPGGAAAAGRAPARGIAAGSRSARAPSEDPGFHFVTQASAPFGIRRCRSASQARNRVTRRVARNPGTDVVTGTPKKARLMKFRPTPGVTRLRA